MMPTRFSGDVAKDLVEADRELAERHEELKKKYPDLEDEMRVIDALAAKVGNLKLELKDSLVEEDDYDIHEVNGKKYSVSKVVKLSVKDIDLVPGTFKSIMEVADEKKAQGHYKLYGTPPDGFEDKSYNKLNYKDA